MFLRTLKTALRPFQFRGKAKILHALSAKEGEETVDIFGYKLELDLSDYIQRSIYLNTFEQAESNLVSRYLKRGMTLVDVGANVGYYTLMGASLVGNEGRVLAFEPSPYAFKRLANTIKKNDISHVQIAQMGLSDKAGTLQLYMPEETGNHTPSMIGSEGGLPLDVPVCRLDEYLTAANVNSVDLIKIDVEGFEPNVIRGSENYLKLGKIRAILCEFNTYWLEENKTKPNQLYDEILQYGFRPSNGKPDFSVAIQNVLFTL